MTRETTIRCAKCGDRPRRSPWTVCGVCRSQICSAGSKKGARVRARMAKVRAQKNNGIAMKSHGSAEKGPNRP